MAGRVSIGGREMELQDAIDELEEQLRLARNEALRPVTEHLNATIREMQEEAVIKPNYDLVSSIDVFDGEKPDTIVQFFERIDDVGELSHWGAAEKLRVAKLRISGAAQTFIKSEDQNRLSTYDEFKEVLTQRFSDKAPQHCYFQQLSVVQQRRGETIEAFADRVKALNEKTIRITANPEVNTALRGEADRRALDAFVRGLTGTVGEQTRLKFPTTLRDAITTAIAIEHLVKPISEHKPSLEKKIFQTELTCYKCHKKGHISKECRSQVNQERSPRVTCWRCNKIGHRQKDCRVRLPAATPSRSQQSGNDSGARGIADTMPRN